MSLDTQTEYIAQEEATELPAGSYGPSTRKPSVCTRRGGFTLSTK